MSNTENKNVREIPRSAPQPLTRSAEEKEAILAAYKDHQREKCFYCHQSLLVGRPEDPFFNDRAFGINAINFVTYRKDPFAATLNGDFEKKWICQERAWVNSPPDV